MPIEPTSDPEHLSLAKLCHRNLASLIESLGTVSDRDTIYVQLKGELQDGTQIQGQDVIVILKKGKEKFPPPPED